jgi:hypothetical protein
MQPWPSRILTHGATTSQFPVNQRPSTFPQLTIGGHNHDRAYHELRRVVPSSASWRINKALIHPTPALPTHPLDAPPPISKEPSDIAHTSDTRLLFSWQPQQQQQLGSGPRSGPVRRDKHVTAVPHKLSVHVSSAAAGSGNECKSTAADTFTFTTARELVAEHEGEEEVCLKGNATLIFTCLLLSFSFLSIFFFLLHLRSLSPFPSSIADVSPCLFMLVPPTLAAPLSCVLSACPSLPLTLCFGHATAIHPRNLDLTRSPFSQFYPYLGSPSTVIIATLPPGSTFTIPPCRGSPL